MNKDLIIIALWFGISFSVVTVISIFIAFLNGNWETVLRFNAYGEGWFELIAMPITLIFQLIVLYKLMVEK